MPRAARLAVLGALWAAAALMAIPGAIPGAAAAAALAATTGWAVAPGESQVLFDYQRNGKPAEGHFGSFSGDGTFDPAAPAAATLEIRIESASIDLNDPTASAFATSAEWFDSANHPQVVYHLRKLTPESPGDGGNRYRALGELTIRGKTKAIETVITLTIDDGKAHASGALVLDRTEYWLGVGPSALFVDIGDEVSVSFDLVARPVR